MKLPKLSAPSDIPLFLRHFKDKMTIFSVVLSLYVCAAFKFKLCFSFFFYILYSCAYAPYPRFTGVCISFEHDGGQYHPEPPTCAYDVRVPCSGDPPVLEPCSDGAGFCGGRVSGCMGQLQWQVVRPGSGDVGGGVDVGGVVGVVGVGDVVGSGSTGGDAYDQF